MADNLTTQEDLKNKVIKEMDELFESRNKTPRESLAAAQEESVKVIGINEEIALNAKRLILKTLKDITKPQPSYIHPIDVAKAVESLVTAYKNLKSN
jgi:hypothetical protein